MQYLQYEALTCRRGKVQYQVFPVLFWVKLNLLFHQQWRPSYKNQKLWHTCVSFLPLLKEEVKAQPRPYWEPVLRFNSHLELHIPLSCCVFLIWKHVAQLLLYQHARVTYECISPRTQYDPFPASRQGSAWEKLWMNEWKYENVLGPAFTLTATSIHHIYILHQLEYIRVNTF